MSALSRIYGMGMSGRNMLFDRGVFPVHHLERPVVCAGNLSTGGAGKTPFVIALGKLLQERGISFNVLSRGYGRETRGVKIVDPNGSASEVGDEPLLIARKLCVPVIVGESRYEAGRLAEKKFQSQIHLLDDGFQHRSLARSVDIVLLNEADLQDRLLPTGRLREPLESLRRADVIVLPQSLATRPNVLPDTPIFRMKRELLLAGVPQTPIVFCGLARPEQFFTQVRASGVVPAAEIAFRDHHSYRESDIQRLLATANRLGAGSFLTTEKDAINLGKLRERITGLTLAELKLTIDRPVELLDTILAAIANRKAGS
jgi:tetraacyldisaccharide 4'-kinase